MDFSALGQLTDGLKMIVYTIPLIYLIIKGKGLKLKHFYLFVVGLSLLLFGHILDFLDEFTNFNNIFIIGKDYPLHDLFEDTIGFTIGFLVIVIAVYLEMKERY